MKGQGLNDLPRCELERRSSHHKGIFFEVPSYLTECGFVRHRAPSLALRAAQGPLSLATRIRQAPGAGVLCA